MPIAARAGDAVAARLPHLAALSAEDMSELCGRCHRTWSQIALNGPRGVNNVRFQPYRLANSKCYDAADRRIRCTACHDPHAPVETKPGQLRREMRRLPLGGAAHQGLPGREGKLRRMPHAENGIARRACAIHRSSDPHRPRGRSLSKLKTDMSRTFRSIQPAAISGRCRGACSSLRAAEAAQAPPLFEEIPPEVSGIRWVHDNAASVEHYLPETMGPGCAFLDYDNDGWMDIFLVNSGPMRLLQAVETDSQRALQEQSRRHLHRCHGESRRRRQHLRHGRRGRRLRQRWLPRPVPHRVRPADSVSQQRQRHFHRCERERQGSARSCSRITGPPARSGSISTTTAGSDLFVCSFVDYGTTSHFSCGDNKLGKHFYCIPRVFKGTASLLFHNNGDGTFTEVGRGTDIEKALGKGLGVVATDVNNDGRMDLFVANDTVQNFLFMNRGPDAKRQNQMGGDRARRRSGLQQRWPGAIRAWAWMRPISMATAGRIFSWPMWIRRCSRCTRT